MNKNLLQPKREGEIRTVSFTGPTASNGIGFKTITGVPGMAEDALEPMPGLKVDDLIDIQACDMPVIGLAWICIGKHGETDLKGKK